MDDSYFATRVGSGPGPAAARPGTPVVVSEGSPAAAPTDPARVRSRPVLLRRGLLVAAVLACLVIAATTVVRYGPAGDRRLPAGLSLPGTLVGLPTASAERDFGSAEDWRRVMRQTFGDGAVAGRAYGPGPDRTPAQLNLVYFAGDGRGRSPDLTLAGPEEQRLGEVSCTRSIRFGEDQPVRPHPRHSICWRASDDLTVSVFVLGAPPDYLPTAARAVQEAWDAVGRAVPARSATVTGGARE